VSYRVGKGIHIRGCSFNAKWWTFYWNCTGARGTDLPPPFF